MDALERDYTSVLLANHEPPCLSLYQPTHRAHPERATGPHPVSQSRARTGNVTAAEIHGTGRARPSCARSTTWPRMPRSGTTLSTASRRLRPRTCSRSTGCGGQCGDWRSLPTASTPSHSCAFCNRRIATKSSASTGRKRRSKRRQSLRPRRRRTAIRIPAHRHRGGRGGRGWARAENSGVWTSRTRPDDASRHGCSPGQGGRRHGIFFRAVDETLLAHYSQPTGMPLLLAALPEHHHLLRAVSRNPALMPVAIDVYPAALSDRRLCASAPGGLCCRTISNV